MNVLINPKPLSGDIKIPPSKSLSHRAIIAACLAKGKSIIKNIGCSDDVVATIAAMEKMGATICRKENNLVITGLGRVVINDDNFIDCNESGSTLRFLMPVMALSKQKVVFTGKPSLFKRPMQIYETILKEQKFDYHQSEKGIILNGTLNPGHFKIPGNISSQFVSGLLFALPLLKGDSTIELTSPLESEDYVKLTIDTLKKFRIRIETTATGYFIEGSQTYKPTTFEIESDFSQLAFFAVAGIIGSSITCKNVSLDSLQPDKRILDFIEQMGGIIVSGKEDISFHSSPTKGIRIDVSQSPDIAPILGLLGALSSGITVIENAERLKFKESNRLKATYETLKALHVSVEMTESSLIIQGGSSFSGGEFDSFNDHRIAMMIAIAAIKAKNPVLIKRAEAINKSYPHFFQDYQSLGGDVTILEE